jgi:1-acyl-sn-glycerol-3-phosphate acyltransferase
VPVVLLFVFFLIALILFLLVAYLSTLHINVDEVKERPNPFGVFICEEFAAFLLYISGIRVVLTGLEKVPVDRRFLLVSNHRSNLDPIVIMDKMRSYNIAFISKISNLKIPAIGKLIHEWCFMSIDRENARNAIKTIQQASNYIKNDIVSIGIYPEGTRSKSQQMGEFHAGSFKIAQKAGCPLVISVIRGTETVKYHFWSVSKVYVDILEVIEVDQVKSMKSVELADYSKKVMADFIRSKGEDPGM